MTDYEIHEALLQHIAETGFPTPGGIRIPEGHVSGIPSGEYARDQSGTWIRTGPVLPRNPNLVWHSVSEEQQ